MGALGQGEFTDRFGRKAVYQFNLLLFGLATIAGAWAPNLTWLLVCRFIAGIGLGAEQPLCFSYTAEYAPKHNRGRIIALMQFIGGAWPWPVGALFVLEFRDIIHWRGIWTVVGIVALIDLRAALLAAGIATLAGDARPRATRARAAATDGHAHAAARNR